MNKGIIYYTDNKLNSSILKAAQDTIAKSGLPIVSCSLEPISFGKNICLEGKVRGYETYFIQILTALENSSSEIIFLCEHDVLYHPSHFEFVPDDINDFCYNFNWWRVRNDGFAVRWDSKQVSGLCSGRENLIKYYRHKVKSFDYNNFNRLFEPKKKNGEFKIWNSTYPNIDVRHDTNMTAHKWSINSFKDKRTAKNYIQSTVDKIEGWQLDIETLYGKSTL